MNDYRDMGWYDGPDGQEPPEDPDVTKERRSRTPAVVLTAAIAAAAVAGGMWFNHTRQEGGTTPKVTSPSASRTSSASSTSSAPAASSSSPSTSWPVTTTTRPTTPAASSAGGPSDDSTDPAQKERNESAKKEARTVMELFARPKLAKEKWFAELKPHLDANMADSMSFTDPTTITPTKVTGAPVVRPMHATDAREVAVPTDAGVWTVTMTYDPDTKKWATAAVTGPKGK